MSHSARNFYTGKYIFQLMTISFKTAMLSTQHTRGDGMVNVRKFEEESLGYSIDIVGRNIEVTEMLRSPGLKV